MTKASFTFINLLLVFFVLSTKCNNVKSLLVPSASKEHSMLNQRMDSSLSFKKVGDDESSKPSGMIGWFSSWKSKLMNSAGVPVSDTGNRYHIRIRDLNSIQGRHVSLK
jgi:hypothetical protein